PRVTGWRYAMIASVSISAREYRGGFSGCSRSRYGDICGVLWKRQPVASAASWTPRPCQSWRNSSSSARTVSAATSSSKRRRNSAMLIGCWAHSSAASMTILASCVFIGTIRIGAGWRSSARLVRKRSNGQFAVLAGTAPCFKRVEPRPGRTTGSASIGYRVGRLGSDAAEPWRPVRARNSGRSDGPLLLAAGGLHHLHRDAANHTRRRRSGLDTRFAAKSRDGRPEGLHLVLERVDRVPERAHLVPVRTHLVLEPGNAGLERRQLAGRRVGRRTGLRPVACEH